MAGQGGRDVRIERLRVEYARWMLLDRVTREANGLPTSHEGWASLKEISGRSLRRWRNDDESFAALLEEEQRRAAGRLPGGSIRRVELDGDADDLAEVEEARGQGVTDPAELEYLTVKRAIIEKAKDGDRESLGQYMKHWGHEFASAEKEQRSAGFAHMTDDELVDEVRGLLGRLEVLGG